MQNSIIPEFSDLALDRIKVTAQNVFMDILLKSCGQLDFEFIVFLLKIEKSVFFRFG